MPHRPHAPAVALLLLVGACGAPQTPASTTPRGSPAEAAPVRALRDSQLPSVRGADAAPIDLRHYERARTALAESLMRERVAGETASREAMQSPGPSPEDAARRSELAQPITFLAGGYQLTPEARRTLERKGLILAAYPAARLRIAGSTDASWPVAPDTLLGGRRAHAAKAFLVGLGIAADRLDAVSARPETGVAVHQAAFELLTPWRPLVRE